MVGSMAYYRVYHATNTHFEKLAHPARRHTDRSPITDRVGSASHHGPAAGTARPDDAGSRRSLSQPRPRPPTRPFFAARCRSRLRATETGSGAQREDPGTR